MATWLEISQTDMFKNMDPLAQFSLADKFFADQSGLDPGAPEFQDLRTRFRAKIMPTLKMGERSEKPTAQDFSGNQVPVEDLGFFAQAGHGMANELEKIGLGATKAANAMDMFGDPERAGQLGREEIAMRNRHGPIDETLGGTIGGIAPAFLIPGGGPVKAVEGASKVPMLLRKAGALLKPIGTTAAGGAAYEGLRGGNPLEGAAAFGVGHAVGQGLGAGVRGVVNRVRAPARGGRQPNALEIQHAKEVKDATDLNFKISVAGRTGGRYAKGLESVMEDLPVTSGTMKAFRDYNKINANQKLANQWGSDAQVLTKDVIAKDMDTVGQEFQKYVQADAPIRVDDSYMVQMGRLKRQVELLPKDYQSPELLKIFKNFYDPVVGLKGVETSGERYKLLRTELNDVSNKLYRKEGAKNASRQVGEVITALDDMASRSVPKELQESYKAARYKWKALNIARDSVDESGNVVKSKLDRSRTRHTPKPGKGDDFYEKLSTSMKVVNEGMPNSGTPARDIGFGDASGL